MCKSHVLVLFVVSFGISVSLQGKTSKACWAEAALMMYVVQYACIWLSSPSVAEQEGSCVITHSAALTSSINSSQIVITCFQDVALTLWPISSHSAGLQTASRKARLAPTCREGICALRTLSTGSHSSSSSLQGERKVNVTEDIVHKHISRCKGIGSMFFPLAAYGVHNQLTLDLDLYH